MKIIPSILCVAIGFAYGFSPACGETLKADAILCEIEGPLALLSESNLIHQRGSEVMKRVAASSKFYVLQGQYHTVLRDLATKEQEIWKDTRYPDRGATASRIADATAAIQKSEASAKPYAEFLSRCIATPDIEQPATVIESRPISGAVRVKALFRGNEHDFWTRDFYLK